MELAEYISDTDRAQKLAASLGTSTGWLWQIANRWRGKKASAELATRIERATAELGPVAVPRSSLRPDLFFTGFMVAANDDIGPANEENGDGSARACLDVEGAQGAEAKVHAPSMERGQGARYVRGDAP